MNLKQDWFGQATTTKLRENIDEQRGDKQVLLAPFLLLPVSALEFSSYLTLYCTARTAAYLWKGKMRKCDTKKL